MVASHARQAPRSPTSRAASRSVTASILDFERQWWKYAGAKEQAVREKFDMSSTRYYQVLNALIDRPEALDARPAAGPSPSPAPGGPRSASAPPAASASSSEACLAGRRPAAVTNAAWCCRRA